MGRSLEAAAHMGRAAASSSRPGWGGPSGRAGPGDAGRETLSVAALGTDRVRPFGSGTTRQCVPRDDVCRTTGKVCP